MRRGIGKQRHGGRISDVNRTVYQAMTELEDRIYDEQKRHMILGLIVAGRPWNHEATIGRKRQSIGLNYIIEFMRKVVRKVDDRGMHDIDWKIEKYHKFLMDMHVPKVKPTRAEDFKDIIKAARVFTLKVQHGVSPAVLGRALEEGMPQMYTSWTYNDLIKIYAAEIEAEAHSSYRRPDPKVMTVDGWFSQRPNAYENISKKEYHYLCSLLERDYRHEPDGDPARAFRR